MKNVGEMPATYVVFEFHGRHCHIEAPYDPRFSRRLLAVLRDPKRLASAVGRRVRSLLKPSG